MLILLLFASVAMPSGFIEKENSAISTFPNDKIEDSIASVAGFKEVYEVLMSPRCMKCHPSGDVPLQGDDSHLHTMNVPRGKDGKGLFALKCSHCHPPENPPGLHTPPCHPKWQLPPATITMVFQCNTAHHLTLPIKTYTKNGQQNKDH